VADNESSSTTLLKQSRPTILVVDDTEGQRYAVAYILRRAGFNVLEAATGEECLRLIARRPDLVVLDVNLPDVDGFEVCRRIKSDAATVHIPVLHLSATFVTAEYKVQGLEGGADGYLTQQVEPEELIANVKALLRIKQAEEEARRQRDEAQRTERELKKALDELYSSEQRHRLAQLAGAIGTWDWDIANGRIFWSDEYYQLFGLEKSCEPTYENWLNSILPEFREQADRIARKALEGGSQDLNFDFPIKRASDGETRCFNVRGVIMRDSDGRPVRMIGATIDITERQRAEDALKRSNERLLLAHRAAGMWSWEFDARARTISHADDDNSDVFGWWSEALPVSEWLERRVHPEDRSRVMEALDLALDGGEDYEIEFRLAWPDGEWHWIHSRGTVLNDEAGNPTRILGVSMDVSHRKEMEHRLRRADTAIATGMLASSLAHEINNPLAATTNLLYLIGNEAKLDEETLKLARLAQDELSRISRICKQLLNVYGTAAPAPLRIAEVLDDVLASVEGQISAKAINVVKQYDPEAMIEASPDEIRKAFANLLLNALQVLRTGDTLSLTVGCKFDERQNRRVTVQIEDTGPGISEEHQTNIFDAFFTTESEKGRGLGLFVTKNIVEKYGGSIQIRSSVAEKSSGTCASVELPAIAVPRKRSRRAAGANGTAATTEP